MTLRASAFLGIWHDIDPAYESEWHRWHTFEHMPERAAVPGFRVGRRYMHNDAVSERCFTMYEADSLSTFKSEPYIERLNNPTDWTKRMMPAFRNLVRGACRVVASTERSAGYGGAVQTIRLSRLRERADFQILADRLGALDDIIGAHIGICEHAATQANTNEGTLRSQTTEERFNAVVIVESIDREKLAANIAAAHKLIETEGCAIDVSQGYELAYVIGNDMA